MARFLSRIVLICALVAVAGTSFVTPAKSGTTFLTVFNHTGIFLRVMFERNDANRQTVSIAPDKDWSYSEVGKIDMFAYVAERAGSPNLASMPLVTFELGPTQRAVSLTAVKDSGTGKYSWKVDK